MFQNGAKKIVLFLIVGTLSLVMGVIGFGGPSAEGCNASGPVYAAQVYGHTITEGDFRAAYTLTGFSRYPAERAQSLRLREHTLNGLIERELLVREAEELGFTADPEEVLRRVAADEVVALGGPVNAPDGYPAGDLQQSFRDRDGNFSGDNFRRFIQYHLHRSVDEFVQWQSRETLANHVRQTVTAPVSISPRELWETYVQETDRAKLSYVDFNPNHYEGEVEFTDDELSAWIAEHGEDLDQSYRRQRHRYTDLEPQTRSRHILIKVEEATASDEDRAQARARAQALLVRAQGGEDFAALASEFSEDVGSAVRGGDLGFNPRGRMVAPFDEAQFTQEIGAVSAELVETRFGFHIILVEARREGDVPEDEAKRELAEVGYREEQAQELAHQAAIVALAYLAEGHSMEELTARMEADWAPEVAAVVEADAPTDADGAALAALDALEASEENAAERGPLAPQVRETRHFGRADRALPGAFDSTPLSQAAFEMTLEDPLPEEPIQLGDNWFIYRLRERTIASEEEFTEDVRRGLEERLLVLKRQEALSAYIAELRSQAESDAQIRINEELLGYGIASDTDDDDAEESDEGASASR